MRFLLVRAPSFHTAVLAVVIVSAVTAGVLLKPAGDAVAAVAFWVVLVAGGVIHGRLISRRHGVATAERRRLLRTDAEAEERRLSRKLRP